MTRVKAGFTRRRRHKKILKATKGFRGARRTRFKAAKEAVIKARFYQTRDRKNRKRDFRRLWITRINAAVRQSGMSYSDFINRMKNQNILLNRKMLSEIAVRHPEAFRKIVEALN
jgi:large subunit ribosomal protein L20